MVVKLKTVVLNDTPKCRSREARECGSVPRLRVPRMRERKARKVESKKSGKLGIWESGNVLCSRTIQSIGMGCPKWIWCRAVRVGMVCPKWL
ncbi:MAG: hypothetical protein WC721_14865 [Victivallaceae bacterium]